MSGLQDPVREAQLLHERASACADSCPVIITTAFILTSHQDSVHTGISEEEKYLGDIIEFRVRRVSPIWGRCIG